MDTQLLSSTENQVLLCNEFYDILLESFYDYAFLCKVTSLFADLDYPDQSIQGLRGIYPGTSWVPPFVVGRFVSHFCYIF